MKTTPLSPAEKALNERLEQAALLMDQDPNLKLFREEFLSGLRAKYEGLATAAARGPVNLETLAIVKGYLYAADALKDFQEKLRAKVVPTPYQPPATNKP